MTSLPVVPLSTAQHPRRWLTLLLLGLSAAGVAIAATGVTYQAVGARLTRRGKTMIWAIAPSSSSVQILPWRKAIVLLNPSPYP